ncbi:hypothetical protein CLV63_10398 [Murinocardiopsis flavida]|uniref:Uncharacterized protein n=1 Tax=Murinocardiopsis flavida TaxID=645275 RepID=A0A2P8DQ75_9ACTN|nr:hypothetical protein [Murinocardiopsis flavida]PSK99375.1 hypothetical protein CLV63_10398 [Murinocardiopsis flavida]
MTAVTPDPAYPVASFEAPAPYGYIYAGKSVSPPSGPPLVRRSAERDDVIEEWRAIARTLAARPDVVKATVYQAVLIPPIKGTPAWDVLLLVQTASPEAVPDVRSALPADELDADSVMAMRNPKRIGETERTMAGTFLFNHFTAPSPERGLAVWETLTGWYTVKTGIDNSTPLQPVGDGRFAVVNYVRLPCGPVRFLLLRQLARPSFWRFVRGRLTSHGMVSYPILAKVV